ncbi:hypothetical protein [Halochromatium roseum]|nr:hypothetical protein [Halochromatium roseum]
MTANVQSVFSTALTCAFPFAQSLISKVFWYSRNNGISPNLT